MTTERDITRVVRSWLRTDEHESAGRVLDHVLAALDATPQRRRPLWPAWRIAPMNNYARIAIAAAAVVVVAVVGYKLLPSTTGPGAGTPSPSPTSTITALPFPTNGALSVGRHSMTLAGKTFTFDIPVTGWTSNGEFALLNTDGTSPTDKSFIFWPHTPVGVFSDPCGGVRGPMIGASTTNLAAAVATIPGTDLVSGPTDVTVGGKPAKSVVLTVREDIACAANDFKLWYSPSVGEERYATALGQTIMTWIIDVDGTTVWIDGETYKGAGPEPGQAVRALVGSIHFE